MLRMSSTAIVAVLLLVGAPALAQTTVPGDAVDIELFDPIDGDNIFCVAPAAIFEVRAYFRPGTGTTSCTLACSPPSVPGGSANVATAVIDIAFDTAELQYVPGSLSNNPATAARQGLPQEQNAAAGRVGWASAGSWSDPGNPGSTLLSPCDMELLTSAGWLFSAQFQAVGTGTTSLHLRRESDDPPFALSVADICGSAAFTLANGGIDEAVNAAVLISDSCASLIFFDGFEAGDLRPWTASQSG